MHFQNVEILGVRLSRESKCVTMSNFVAIGQIVAEIWQFFDFAHLAPKMIAK